MQQIAEDLRNLAHLPKFASATFVPQSGIFGCIAGHQTKLKRAQLDSLSAGCLSGCLFSLSSGGTYVCRPQARGAALLFAGRLFFLSTKLSKLEELVKLNRLGLGVGLSQSRILLASILLVTLGAMALWFAISVHVSGSAISTGLVPDLAPGSATTTATAQAPPARVRAAYAQLPIIFESLLWAKTRSTKSHEAARKDLL